MNGILNVTVGDVDGITTIVLAMGGIHEMGSEIEILSLHVLEAISLATTLLENRGTAVNYIVMDERRTMPELRQILP